MSMFPDWSLSAAARQGALSLRRMAVTLALAAGACVLVQAAAGAAEIKVLTTGALKPVALETAARFTQASGTAVTTTRLVGSPSAWRTARPSMC